MRWPYGPPPKDDEDEPPKLRDLVELVEGPIFHRYDQMFVMLTESESKFLEEGDLIRIGIHYYELLEPARFSDVGRCYLCRPFRTTITDQELKELRDELA